MKSNLPRLKKYFASHRGIGRRLLVSIVLFSSVVTLLATLFQLYLDYQRDVGDIERRLAEIESSYIDSIGASLWNLDIDQLGLQLEGIMRLPDLQAVQIVELGSDLESPLILSKGQHTLHSSLNREFAITYSEYGNTKVIGTLYVQATLTKVYQRLIDKAVVILFSQGVKTFLVCLFILYIFYRLVTRHLATIATSVGGFDPRQPLNVLKLNRQQPKEIDELDKVVNAFNEMCASLKGAYEELQAMNVALEQDNIARRRAEEEVTRLNSVLEQRVRQRTAELEAANMELGAFSYSVSHDLRAPLRRIEGFRRILVDEYAGQLDEKGQHYLQRIEAGTRDMVEMIDSFLSLSRSTRADLTVQKVDLSKAVNKAIRHLQEKEPDRQMTVNIAEGVVVQGDRRLLDVLIVNLVENAWKYSQHKPDPVIEFAVDNTSSAQIYYIRDNGAGFDMAFAERLFTPFTRLHQSEQFDGIGIGLATVQRIIMRHGGRVWAEAAPGEGATFYFTFWDKELG